MPPAKSTRKQVGFAAKPAMTLIRTMFPLLSAVAPGLAARLSLRIFLTPQRYRTPAWEAAFRESASIATLQIAGQSIAVYRWGTGEKKVLLCHSWGGRGTQLASFVAPLLERGCSVVAFDAPAHGRSSGQRTDMMKYSEVIGRVVHIEGRVHAIIGHSFGAGNTMFAKQRHGFAVDRIVLIGCFAHGAWITDRFGQVLNIPARIIESMRKRLEHRYPGQLRWSELDIAAMVAKDAAEIMLVHDKDDQEIPYVDGAGFQQAPGTRRPLLTTTGLGHRRILRDSDVIHQVCSFIDTGLPASVRAP